MGHSTKTTLIKQTGMSVRRGFTILASVSGPHWGIGYQNKIPWQIPILRQRFDALTKQQAVIMGRMTWNSLDRPLHKRLNLCVSTKFGLGLNDAIGIAQRDNVHPFVIGGQKLFTESICHPLCTEIRITNVIFWKQEVPKFDSWFPLHSLLNSSSLFCISPNSPHNFVESAFDRLSRQDVLLQEWCWRRI